MFKFQDFDGKILALRAEMTAPVARIAATRLSSSLHNPLRLSYVSNVFRYNQRYIETGREFWQAGIELMGGDTTEADGEVLSLLVSALRQIGLREVRVDVGHAGLLKELMKATGLGNDKRRIFQSLLASRNQGQLAEFMEQNDFPPKLAEVFLQLSCCRRLTEVSSISVSVPNQDKVRACLRNLVEIEDVVSSYGVENTIFFDFSLTRRIEYYTGIVFEASVPTLGLPLAGGGRYDDFVERFGKLKMPATGFALEIEKCLQALAAQGFSILGKSRPRILVSSKFRNAATEALALLREAGLVALMDVARNNEEQTVESARSSKTNYVVFVGSSLQKPAVVYDVECCKSRKVTIETFLQDIKEQC
jgi:ATP phosphoribosyltransferase regulatory subunit